MNYEIMHAVSKRTELLLVDASIELEAFFRLSAKPDSAKTK